MPIDPSIPLSITPTPSAAGQINTALSLRTLTDQRQALAEEQRARAQLLQQESDKQARAAQGSQVLTQALRDYATVDDNGKPDWDYQQVYHAVSQAGFPGVADAWLKTYEDRKKQFDAIWEANSTAQAHKQAWVRQALEHVAGSPDPEAAWTAERTNLQGLVDAQTLQARVPLQYPGAEWVTQTIESLKSPEEKQKAEAAKTEQRLKTAQAASAEQTAQKTAAEIAGTLPETPAQKQTRVNQEQERSLAERRLALENKRFEFEKSQKGQTADDNAVTYWADQVVRDPQNAKNPLLTSNKGLQQQVSQELVKRGVDLNNLDASSRAMAVAAKDVERVTPDIRKEAEQINQLGLFGPVGSRWRDFMGNKIGATEFVGGDAAKGRLLGRFRADVGLLKTALMKAHVGSRGGTNLLDEFNNLLNADRTDYSGFQGALDGVDRWMQVYGSRIPDKTAPAAAPAPAQSVPQGLYQEYLKRTGRGQ